jgi:hypothetical protein
MEPGRFMATVIRLGHLNDCTIRVRSGQSYNSYENKEEVLTNVPLKSLQLTSVTNVPLNSLQLTSMTTELQDKLSRLASMPGVMAAV